MNLRVFDSGFFAATPAKQYDFTHNLGTNKLIVRVYFSIDPSGAESEEVICDASGGRLIAGWIGAFAQITPLTLSVQTGGAGLTRFSRGVRSRGFYRVIAIALP